MCGQWSSKPRRASYFVVHFVLSTSNNNFSPFLLLLNLQRPISNPILESQYNLGLNIYISNAALFIALPRRSCRGVPWRGNSLKYYPPTHSLVTTGCYLTVPAQTTTSTRAQERRQDSPLTPLFDLSPKSNPPPPPTQCRGKSQRVRIPF